VLYWVGSRPKQQIDLTGRVDARNVRVAEENKTEDLQNLLAKNFKLKNLDGQEVELESYRGKPILLHFWATWCPPCVDEMPELLKFAQVAKKKWNLDVLAISVDEGVDLIRRFFDEKKIWPNTPLPFTILNNPDSTVAELYNVSGYPETFFIDKELKLVRKFIGPQKWGSEEMTQWLQNQIK
jgi:thiol-disulfide isomerase/thioredoxin